MLYTKTSYPNDCVLLPYNESYPQEMVSTFSKAADMFKPAVRLHKTLVLHKTTSNFRAHNLSTLDI